MPHVAADVTPFSRQAEEMLRNAAGFQWSTVFLLGVVFYVYSVEVERRRWDIILAGLALWFMDWFNELMNSAVLHISDRAALWTVTGHTSYLILIGLTIELTLFFLMAGVVFVKFLPPDRTMRIVGIPNRWVYVVGFSCLSVVVEIFLHATGYFHWEYWFWNVPFVPLIVIFGYMTFYGVAAWVFDMRENHRRQVAVVGAIAGIDAVLALGFGLAGWL
jgi:hypothetical protein